MKTGTWRVTETGEEERKLGQAVDWRGQLKSLKMASGSGDTVKEVSQSDAQSGLGTLAGAGCEVWAWLEAGR